MTNTDTDISASNETITKVVEHVLIEPKIHNKLKSNYDKLKSNYDKLKSKVNKDEQSNVLDKSKIDESGVQSKQELSVSIINENEDEKEELSQTELPPSTPNKGTFSPSRLVLEPKEIESPSRLVLEPKEIESPSRLVLESNKIESLSRLVLESNEIESPSRPVLESNEIESPSRPVLESNKIESLSRLVLESNEIESPYSPVELQKKYESDFEFKKTNTDKTICQFDFELKKMNTDETICKEIPFVNFNEPIVELIALKLYCGDRLAKIADRMKALPVVFQTAKHISDVIKKNPNVYELKKFDQFNVTYDDYLKHRFELSDKKSSFTSHNTHLLKESTKFQIEDARIIKCVKEILHIMKPLCDRYKDTDFL